MTEHPFFAKPPKIHTLTGHLTARKKQVIVEMLKRHLDNAQTSKITYHLSKTADNEYTLRTEEKQQDDFGRPTIGKYKETFRLV